VENLFDPSKPVFNAGGWIAGLRSRKEFGSAALSLKDLMNIPGFTKLHVSEGDVIIPVNGLRHSLDELSAGYESVLVMATEIIAGAMGRNRDFRHTSGVVLLDEIDAHLHPRWKMKIVESLRRTFPAMQFIVTTHEPLCLRGVEKGEVVVLEKIGREVTALNDLPAPNTLRVDQLLTSNFFGLGSTIDPSLEKELNRYYELLAKEPSQLTSREKTERDALRGRLQKYEYRLMADTPGEELVYEAIDEYVAKDVSLRGEERKKLPALRGETKKAVATIWKQANLAAATP
jgi:hypothetical protein